MNDNVFIGLINNAALLLSLGLIYDIVYRGKREAAPRLYQIISGFIIGGMAIVLMLTPVKFEAGIIFDTRTILLGLAGFFFGAIPTLFAMTIAGAYRLSLGGGGALMGVGTIVSSGLIGLAWRYRRFSKSKELTLFELYLFGALVHAVMILCMFLLPQDAIFKTIRTLALPIIIIYPIGTALLGNLLTSRQRRHRIEVERKQEEEQLLASEMKLKEASKIAQLGHWELDLSCAQLNWSEGIFEMFEIDSNIFGATYESFLNTIHPDDRDRVNSAYTESLKNKIPYEIIHRLMMPDGRIKWVIEICRTDYDVQGKPFRSFGIVQDITERKQAEQEKDKLQAQLIQAQKMESVGRLAGGVAHDFNNMLGVIIGHSDMILEDLDPALPLYAELEAIRNAARRSADLTRQLLGFARKQTVAPKVLDLNQTLEGMLQMLRRLIGEDIDLAWLPGKDLGPVKIDPSQVDQMLANLCINARDAIADVGKVTIETRTAVFDEDYCSDHAGFVPGEFVMLAVSDNGSGMGQETLAQVFEPFFTTKELGKGTGLGLATIYGIVKQNNGFVNVYSEPGQGTAFNIYLPLHIGKIEQILENGPAKPDVRGHETILLVEDDPGILEMSTRMLERLGYTVMAAGTPNEAIHLAGKYAGQIQLLLTDVVMPEMNGRDLAKNLLSSYPNLKHLFISGYTANVIAHHGVLDKGVNFIQKPFSKNDLGDKVREALEKE